MTDKLVDGIVACGDMDVAVDRVNQHLDAGADHVGIQVLAADDDIDVVRGHWRELADDFDL